jgi:hypothetical protein
LLVKDDRIISLHLNDPCDRQRGITGTLTSLRHETGTKTTNLNGRDTFGATAIIANLSLTNSVSGKTIWNSIHISFSRPAALHR